MKIRYQAGILAAALSLSMATAAFAASSSTTGMAGGNSSDRPNKVGSQVVGGTNGSGTRSSGTMSGNSDTGSNVKFVDNFGTSISANQIVQVNEGLASVQSLPSDTDLTGYNPLVRIQNMETRTAGRVQHLRTKPGRKSEQCSGSHFKFQHRQVGVSCTGRYRSSDQDGNSIS